MYYFQVQVQMFARELSLCDFVVWTTVGIVLVEVPFDEQFVMSLMGNLNDFWVNKVLPFMMLQTESDSLTEGNCCNYTFFFPLNCNAILPLENFACP